MDQPFKNEPLWVSTGDDNLRSESPTSRTDRTHSSSASTSTGTTGDSSDTSNGRGRRSRPSVASASSQLPTVREKNQQRALSLNSVNKQSSLARLGSDETVVSSKKVRRLCLRRLFLLLTHRSLGLDQLQQSSYQKCREGRSPAAKTRSV